MADSKTVGLFSAARDEMEREGWDLVRALEGGTRAMREAGARYTPKTDIETRQPARYDRRLARSVLYPGFAKTVSKLSALPFHKAPAIRGELGPNRAKLVEDADRCGTSLPVFAKTIYADAIARGMGLFLVESIPTQIDGRGMTLKEAADSDARPYFARIAPDNFLGAAFARVVNRSVLTEFRYREDVEWGVDGIARQRVRVWTHDTVEVWERELGSKTLDRDAEAASDGGAGSGYALVETIAHGYGGIPLVALYTQKVADLVAKPPLIDLAWLNVAHWNSRSMQGDALAYCRSPILKISGASTGVVDAQPVVGPGATVADRSEKLDVAFVEPAGTSLMAGEREIEMLRLEMEALGMTPLMAAAGPATATGEVRADANEKSEAQAWVEALEWAIHRGFELADGWRDEQTPEDFEFRLHKDSSLMAGRATDIPAIQAMYAANAITRETYIVEMQARGVLVTIEDAAAEVEALEAGDAENGRRQMEALAESLRREREEEEGEPGDPEGDDDEDDDDTPGPPDAEA